jgi:GR25 family glycosyltransferase involved in LPS biosynthesis
MFEEIYVVNLDRNAARLAAFCRVNAHVLSRVRRFSAVDGRALDRAGLVAAGIVEAGNCYAAGALGCAVSHLTLWDYAAREGRMLTVVEDDAVLARGFVAAGEAVVGALPADWDIVLWGWNFDSVLAVELIPGVLPASVFADEAALRRNVAGFQTAGVRAAPVRLLHAFGTLGYSVSAKGAAALLARVLPLHGRVVAFPGVGLRLLNVGIDVSMNEVFAGIQAFVSLPPLAVSENRKEVSTVLGVG